MCYLSVNDGHSPHNWSKDDSGIIVQVQSILRLPQAIDCGGGLVNALGSRPPCRGTNVLSLIFYGQT